MTSDVAIVGAGPAGAWAAYRLARAGARVALFDPSHPREKACGGGVTARAWTLVAGALAHDQVPAVRIRTARFVDSVSGTSATIGLKGPGAGETAPALLVASRAEFDARLLNAARNEGAEVIAARVTDVHCDRDGVTVTTVEGHRHHAAMLVGADGANGLVRRRLATPFRRDQLSIATGFFAHGATSDEVVVELVPDPPGYIWSFPRPTHLAIGICAQADRGVTAAALRVRTAEWIRHTNIAPAARLAWYSWPIPSLTAQDFATLEVAGPRWCLVGDAAGLVDPITREGIYFALRSADLAAEAITSPVAAAEHWYTDRVRHEIASELARAARVKDAFFRPGFSRLLMRALGHSEAIGRVMADLIAGAQPYGSLKWRLARTMEVGLAWDLLTSAKSL